jgi:hypothetical protein
MVTSEQLVAWKRYYVIFYMKTSAGVEPVSPFRLSNMKHL